MDITSGQMADYTAMREAMASAGSLSAPGQPGVPAIVMCVRSGRVRASRRMCCCACLWRLGVPDRGRWRWDGVTGGQAAQGACGAARRGAARR
jgi:hypothetical protein